jgi:FAD/FMN-containing dehydrogenase
MTITGSDPQRLAADLDASIHGRVIRPGDPDFDAARRGHNLAIDAHPALIVRAADADDVAAAVRFAVASNLEIAVRSGGHSIAGHSTGDGVLVIDLSAMKRLDIDLKRRTVCAEAGLTAGELTHALAAHGLAIPFGDNAAVGIGGLTLGGGLGWLARKHGLTIDQLIEVELVTAAGTVLTASATDDPDLFWAVRGGGGNVGVATRFTYQAVSVDAVVGGALWLPATADALLAILDAAEAAPDDLTLIVDTLGAPPVPGMPEAWISRPVIRLAGVFDGPIDAGVPAWAPFRALTTPLVDDVGPMLFPAIYRLNEPAAVPVPHTLRSALLSRFDRAAADAAIAALHAPGRPEAIFELRVLGGALGRVPAEATAFAHRAAPLLVVIITFFGDDPAADIAWTEGLFDPLRPMSAGAYANFLGDEGETRIREAYPQATYDRLAAVKTRLDPANVFHRNQNIRPAD